jgi:hypothetical protein
MKKRRWNGDMFICILTLTLGAGKILGSQHSVFQCVVRPSLYKAGLAQNIRRYRNGYE